MITVCPGWTRPHYIPIVIAIGPHDSVPEDRSPGPNISHGICPACAEDLDREVQALNTYEEYLHGTQLDPRD